MSKNELIADLIAAGASPIGLRRKTVAQLTELRSNMKAAKQSGTLTDPTDAKRTQRKAELGYETSTYDVVLMNMKDGSVQGHGAGCADLKRGVKKFAEPGQADEVWTVESKRDAWFNYNADFIAEGGEDHAWPVQWLPCADHVPVGDAEEPVEAALPAEESVAGDSPAEPEFAADATKDWRGNYSTVYAPAAEQIAAGFVGINVRTVNVSTMLKQTDIAGSTAPDFFDLLVAVEELAQAALRNWQKTLDRKDASDMEKFNQNRSFLSGFFGAAAQRQTGAKKIPVVAFAKDMDKALRPEALTAGAAAHKEVSK